MDGQMEHSKAIWNVYLELQRQVKNKKERAYSYDLELQRKIWKQGKKIVHSDDIWNDLELQRKIWKQGKKIVHSDDIWNDLELQKKNWKQGKKIVHSDDIWNDLEMQRKFWKKDSKGCILTVFETILNCSEKIENKDILTVFETILNCREKKKTLNGAFWRYLNRFGTAEIILTQGRFRVHYCDTFWNDIWYSLEKKQHMLWPH